MTEHLMVFPDRDDADRIAEDLRDEGFSQVRVVREQPEGRADGEGRVAEWAVHVVEEMIVDQDGAVEKGLRERFAKLAEEHDGWYDPRPDA